jgi:hypothetical protein
MDSLLFFMWGGDLPCRHGEVVIYLVSLAQHTGVSGGSYTVEGEATISSVNFGLTCPRGYYYKQIQRERVESMQRALQS